MMQPTDADVALMRHVLALVDADGDDIPVGAIIVDAEGHIIASAHNEREVRNDATAHAEVIAIRDACERLGTWRLDGCTIVVTLEPCPMCAGAISQSRITRVVFGAWNDDYGAAGSMWDLLRDARISHRPEVVAGVLADEASAVLTEFFRQRR